MTTPKYSIIPEIQRTPVVNWSIYKGVIYDRQERMIHQKYNNGNIYARICERASIALIVVEVYLEYKCLPNANAMWQCAELFLEDNDLCPRIMPKAGIKMWNRDGGNEMENMGGKTSPIIENKKPWNGGPVQASVQGREDKWVARAMVGGQGYLWGDWNPWSEWLSLIKRHY